MEDNIPENDAELLMRAAAGWDVFFLCPDKALAEGDRAAALALLERGVALGDAKSRAHLAKARARE